MRPRPKQRKLLLRKQHRRGPVTDDQQIDRRLLPPKMSLKLLELGLQVVSDNLVWDEEQERAYLALAEEDLPPPLRNLPEQDWAYLCQAHEHLLWEREHSPLH